MRGTGWRLICVPIVGALALSFSLSREAVTDFPRDWVHELSGRVQAVDAAFPGNLGLYVKRVRDGTELSYEAHRSWYLASTTKVLIAVILLQQIERGEARFSDVVVLKQSDLVDGSGDLLQTPVGTVLTVETLLEKMLGESDSTAADILIRKIGVKRLNREVRQLFQTPGIGELTSLLQVRKDAYTEVHPKAADLSNYDFIDLKRHINRELRFDALLEKLHISRAEALAPSLDEAFERYYESGRNSGSLSAFGSVLERLTRGELLSPPLTGKLLGWMGAMKTGETRLKAGLPPGTRFAQKTGTQIRRICNVGVVQDDLVVAACAEKFEDQQEAEAALKELGSAISESGALDRLG